MSGPSSPTSPTPLAFYDPESWCWRTSQGCLLSAAPESLERLPDWGTTSDGALFELQMPALLTAARDGSALLGTPTRDNAVRSERFKRKSPNMGELAALLPTPRSFMADMADRPLKIRDVYKCNLEEAIALLPTPRAQNGEPRNMKPWMRPLDEPQNLENALALLPTPVVNDMGANKTVEWWDAWAPNQKAADGRPSPHGKSLSIEVQRLLPTPTVQDGANNAGPSQWNRNSDPLNVVAVKLSGGTTPRPLSDGSESSDGQHPNPPTTGNCPAGSSSG